MSSIGSTIRVVLTLGLVILVLAALAPAGGPTGNAAAPAGLTPSPEPPTLTPVPPTPVPPTPVPPTPVPPTPVPPTPVPPTPVPPTPVPPTPRPPEPTAVPTIITVPGIAVTKTASRRVSAGSDLIEFRIIITNTGNAPALGVQAADQLPLFLDVVSAQATKGAVLVEGRTVRVTISALAPGEIVTITIVARPNGQPQPAGAANTVVITAPGGGNWETSVPVPPRGAPPGLPVTGGNSPDSTPLPDQPTPPEALRVFATEGGMQITLQLTERPAAAPAGQAGYDAANGWPLIEFGGVRLPARLLAVRANGKSGVTPHITDVTNTPWFGQLLPISLPSMINTEGRVQPWLGSLPATTLPAAPVFVLRESWLRGTHIVVLAISPFYAEDGQPRLATSFRAVIPGVQPLSADTSALLAQPEPFLSTAPPPVNPLAFMQAFKVHVSHAGIQRLSAAALAAAGLDLATVDPSQLHLWYRGGEVALAVAGATGGRLAPEGELRFYAPAVGDRWNAGDTYWLTSESSPGLRMPVRYPVPASDPPGANGIGRGVWRANAVYDSVHGGPDDDHWFASELNALSGAPFTITVPLTPSLPPIAAQTLLTITGSAYGSGPHQFIAAMGDVSQTVTWNGSGNWTRTLAFTSSAAAVDLMAVAQQDVVLLDSVSWQRIVRLDAGGEGATFSGPVGAPHYQIANAPSNDLYDVTNPIIPSILVLPAGATLDFQDSVHVAGDTS